MNPEKTGTNRLITRIGLMQKTITGEITQQISI